MNRQVYVAYYYGCLIYQHNQPLSLPLTHQYKFVSSSYNVFAFFLNRILICVDLIQIFFPECKSKSISGGFIHQAGRFGVKNFFNILWFDIGRF